MYGVEEQSGFGGLGARSPAGSTFFARNARAMNSGSLIGGPDQSGVAIPARGIGSMTAIPQVSSTGMHVEAPAAHLLTHWSSILDFHNSPAPWVLIGLLLIYGWTHVSYRGRR